MGIDWWWTVGFTGTQRGMSERQKEALEAILAAAYELRHGDCVGGDKEAHEIARRLGLRVVIHPPSDPKKRAFCDGDVILPPKPYLVRNHDIVEAVSVLIAAPRIDEEELRSGTWATVRYARSVGKRVLLLPR